MITLTNPPLKNALSSNVFVTERGWLQWFGDIAKAISGKWGSEEIANGTIVNVSGNLCVVSLSINDNYSFEESTIYTLENLPTPKENAIISLVLLDSFGTLVGTGSGLLKAGETTCVYKMSNSEGTTLVATGVYRRS